jgi:hypothetical protein
MILVGAGENNQGRKKEPGIDVFKKELSPLKRWKVVS